MTREQVWNEIMRQRPDLTRDPPGRFTQKGLRQFFDRVWDAATDDLTAEQPDVPPFLADLFARGKTEGRP